MAEGAEAQRSAAELLCASLEPSTFEWDPQSPHLGGNLTMQASLGRPQCGACRAGRALQGRLLSLGPGVGFPRPASLSQLAQLHTLEPKAEQYRGASSFSAVVGEW